MADFLVNRKFSGSHHHSFSISFVEGSQKFDKIHLRTLFHLITIMMNHRSFLSFYALLVLVFVFSSPIPIDAKLKGSSATIDAPRGAANVPQIQGIGRQRNLKKDKEEEEEEEGCGTRFWCNVKEVFTGIWSVKKEKEDVIGIVFNGILGIFGLRLKK